MKIARDVENALERLPETLSELYSLILEQIQQMEPEGRKIAMNVLQWLLCAQTKLSVQQLLDLVSIPLREASYKALTTDDLLNVCCNLVVLDKQLDCFRFAHVSVRDFLDDRNGFEHDLLHIMAANRCLDLYWTRPFTGKTTQNAYAYVTSSFAYAAGYWIVHYERINASSRTKDLKERVQGFLVSGSQVKPTFGPWTNYLTQFVTMLDPYDALREKLSSVVANDPANPLFTACAFGLAEIFASLGAIKDLDWLQRNVSSATGMHVAARYGFTKGVEILLYKGIEVNAMNDEGETALHLAAQNGHLETAELLLKKGARTALRDFEDWTPLDQAMKRKDASMVLLLSQNGAKVEATAKWGANVGSWQDKSRQGLLEFMRLLDRPTGYAGLWNEGATGYLNAVLQLFYILRPVHEVGLSSSLLVRINISRQSIRLD